MAATDGSGAPDSREDLQADIENTRAELGQTVDALTTKLDVKSRTQDAAAEAKDKVVEKAQHSKDSIVGTAQTAAANAREHKAIPIRCWSPPRSPRSGSSSGCAGADGVVHRSVEERLAYAVVLETQLRRTQSGSRSTGE
jgi:hypothetical protein